MRVRISPFVMDQVKAVKKRYLKKEIAAILGYYSIQEFNEDLRNCSLTIERCFMLSKLLEIPMFTFVHADGNEFIDWILEKEKEDFEKNDGD